MTLKQAKAKDKALPAREYINAVNFVCMECNRLFIIYYTDTELEDNDLGDPRCPVCGNNNVRQGA